jgi:hypothetical protein
MRKKQATMLRRLLLPLDRLPVGTAIPRDESVLAGGSFPVKPAVGKSKGEQEIYDEPMSFF